MTDTWNIEDAITSGQFDAVEDLWLARLDSAADQIPFFVQAARVMADEGRERTAGAIARAGR